MPTYYSNWPSGYATIPEGDVKKSRDAGAAVARAIEASMRLLRGYELPDDWRYDAAEEMVKHLSTASNLYIQLEENAPHDPILIPPDSRRAFAGALACAEVAGGILLHASITDLRIVAEGPGQDEQAISARSLVRMASQFTGEASNILSTLSLSPSDSAAGRRIAADVAIIQIVGVLVARVIYQNSVSPIH